MARLKSPVRLGDALRDAVHRSGLIVPGDRVLAACSGGADSVALIALLLELRREMPLEVRVAHFNHRLREEAGEDERFVQDLARRWGVPFVRGSRDVRAYAAKRKMNIEEAARELRYAFLRGVARRMGASKIATGHTMTDQAETVLMRILRGTGLSGLAGIAPVVPGEPCPIVRPLLELLRADLRSWLETKGIPYKEDASNLDRRLLRNRVRIELLPEIERRFEPRVVAHLARLAEIAREDDELLADFVRELADEFVLERDKTLSLDLRTLPRVLPGLARRVVREYLRRLRGDLRDVSFDDVESVLGLKEGGRIDLGHGLVLGLRSGRLEPVRARDRGVKSYELEWSGRGRLGLPVAGLVVTGRARKRPTGWRPHRDDRTGADLDLDRLELPLIVRNRRPGDLYRPLGAPGRKKVKEILRARGVPLEDRDRLPVFLSGGSIVWAAGLPVAEGAKVSPGTTRILSLRLREAAPRRKSAQRR